MKKISLRTTVRLTRVLRLHIIFFCPYIILIPNLFDFFFLFLTLASPTVREGIVAKALDGQRNPLPLCDYMWVYDGEGGSGPEGADDLCLVGFEALGLNLSINYGISVSWL